MNDTPAIDDFPAFDEAAALRSIVDIQPIAHPAAGAPGSEFAQTAAKSFKVTTLPPEDRGAILRALETVPAELRDKRESELVAAKLQERTEYFRMRRSLSQGNAYAQAQAQLHLDVRDREREIDRLLAEVETIDRYETRIDPATGKPEPVPVMRFNGEQLKARTDRIRTLQAEVDRLNGPEWARRREVALAQAIEDARKQHQRAAELHAAKKLADKLLSDERVQVQAKAFANARRNRV
jgi:hypothetical protein